ncbi:MAG: AAA family ATPase [Rhodospirillaceae bacterium]|jgi:chromosome partitioning protein|nr:AAA family ATPase [Rhodospirillaceae bacterium]
MIISLAQTKGGVGKTTIAVNITIDLWQRGYDVLLVDADDQQTASDFTALRESEVENCGYTLVELSGANVRNQVIKLAKKHDHVVVDVGGRDTAALRAALTVSDIALLPFQPRSFDIWTFEKMSGLIEEARPFNDLLDAYAILNFCDPSGSDNQDARQALEGNSQIEFLDARLGRRKALANAAAAGRGVNEVRSKDSKACGEMSYLVEKLLKLQKDRENGYRTQAITA